MEAMEASMEAFMEAVLPPFHGSFRGSRGSFHGSYHELPNQKMQIVQVALLDGLREKRLPSRILGDDDIELLMLGARKLTMHP